MAGHIEHRKTTHLGCDNKVGELDLLLDVTPGHYGDHLVYYIQYGSNLSLSFPRPVTSTSIMGRSGKDPWLQARGRWIPGPVNEESSIDRPGGKEPRDSHGCPHGRGKVPFLRTTASPVTMSVATAAKGMGRSEKSRTGLREVHA